MNRKGKCLLAGILSALVMISGGCGSQSSGGNESREERPTITIAVEMEERGDYSDNNFAIRWLEEQTGVNFEFIDISGNHDVNIALDLMLSKGTYPDVICYSLKKSRIAELGAAGIFIPLNDLIEEYGVYTKELFESRPEYEKNAYAPDGNIYGFPKIEECYHCTAYPKLWYHSQWLAALGLKEPTTTQELKEVLLAVKNSDYNGNGRADEIALTGSPEWDCQLEWFLMNSFIPCDKDTLSYVKDGQVIFACDKEAYKQGLTYMHDLYVNGLIDPAAFSQGQDQMRQIIGSDEKLVFAFTADHFGMGIDLYDAHMNEVITAMIPVEGPCGARYQLHTDYVDQSSYFTWFITDHCENPEAAFAVGDFLMSPEASMVQMYGEEGTYWGKLQTPVPSMVPGIDAVYWTNPGFSINEDEAYYKNTWWSGLYGKTVEFCARMQPRPENLYAPEAYEARLIEETVKLEPYFYPEYLPKNIYLENTADAEKFSNIQSSLQEYVKLSMVQFITGELSLDTDWDSYVDSLQNYNAETYVQLYQQAYDSYHAKEP